MSTERRIPCSRKKLLEVSKTTLAVIQQFLIQLTVKGINQQYHDDFAADLDAVTAMKTDKAITDENAAMTASVKAKCKECYNGGMLLKKYLQRKFGKKAVEVGEFPNKFEEIKLDEAAMINTMPQIIGLAKKYKSLLITKGMSEDFDTKGETLLSELDALNKEQAKMQQDASAYTEKRLLAHLNLYDKINYVNDIGREAFANDAVNLKYFESPWKVGNGGKSEEAPPKP